MGRTGTHPASRASSGAWSKLRAAWKKTKHWLDGPGALPWIVNLLLAFIVIKFIVYPALGWIFGTSLPIVAVVSSSMDHSAIQSQICDHTVGDYSSGFDSYWSTCGDWYELRGITKEQFSAFSFRNGFKKGDIMVVLGPSRSTVRQGDILIFSAAENYPIIHRVLATPSADSPYYMTKGDHNPTQIVQYVLIDRFGQRWSCVKDGKPSACSSSAAPVDVDTPGAFRVVDETRISHGQVIGKAVLRIPFLGYVKIWFTDLLRLFGLGVA